MVYGQIPKPPLPEYLIEKPKQIETEFTIVEPKGFPPEFPDGEIKFRQYLFSKLKRPKSIARLIKNKEMSIEFRIDPDGQLSQLVVHGVMNARKRRNFKKTFSSMPAFRIGCGNCFSKNYWFTIDDELLPQVDKSKPKIYAPTGDGFYWILNVKHK